MLIKCATTDISGEVAGILHDIYMLIRTFQKDYSSLHWVDTRPPEAGQAQL